MPSKRADGTLVFIVIVYGPSISENIKVFKWIHEKEKNEEGINIKQIPMGQNILQSVDLPIGKVSNVVFQLITVTGQQGHKIKYENLLKGVDGILFIWDSLLDQWSENIWSLNELLRLYGDKLILTEVPIVVLADKRDLEDIVEISKIRQALDTAKLNHVLIYETIVDQGINVKRAFVYVGRQTVLNHYRKLGINDYKCPLCYSSLSGNQAQRFMHGEIIRCKYCDVEFNAELTSLKL